MLHVNLTLSMLINNGSEAILTDMVFGSDLKLPLSGEVFLAADGEVFSRWAAAIAGLAGTWEVTSAADCRAPSFTLH